MTQKRSKTGRGANLLLGIFVFAAALTVTWSARAQFSPQTCSVCPTMTNVDYTFNSNELPNTASGYLSNVDYTRYVFANRYVKRFDYYVSSFATENNYDYLDTTYDPGSPTFRLTGSSVPAGYRTITTANSTQSFQLHPARFDFHTDTSVVTTGFSIGASTQAKVCCDNTLSSAMPVNAFNDGKRVDGLLLDTNDVVYFWQPVAGSTKRSNMALWGTPATGRDFDLYVRCNAMPTYSAWDYRGFSSDVYEFLTWQEPGSCTSPGTWYIAVHSHNGSGQFSLVRSHQWTATFNPQSRRVFMATDFNATSAELATISNTMSQAARILYGMTEGQILVERLYLWNNVNCANGCGGTHKRACDFCWKNAGSGCGGWSPACGPNMRTQVNLMAHELGHNQLHLPDEYTGFGNPNCGHSIMGNPWGNGSVFNLCYSGDHNRDGTSGISSPNVANWSQLYTDYRVPVMFTQTPDNYHYRDHDFNGKIDVVLR